MLRLDIAAILLSVFLLGPRNWRWNLAAIFTAMISTLLLLLVWQVEITAYTMGGLFSQVSLQEGQGLVLPIALFGPLTCYIVAKLINRKPLGSGSVWRSMLPWSDLEQPAAGAFVKFSVMATFLLLLRLVI